MNADILEQRWNLLRGRVKETWGWLTDDEIDRIGGRMDRLTGLLQVKYEYACDEVDQAISRFLDDDVASEGFERDGASARRHGGQFS